MRKLITWLTLLSSVGPAMKSGRQSDTIFRFHVLDILAKEELFDYLKEPRTYGQILARFGFIDSDYTRELFDILVNDRHAVLLKQGDFFRCNPDVPLPTLGQIIGQVDKRIRDLTLMAQGMARYIPARLRNQPIAFADSFEQDGRQLLIKFNQVLGLKLYTTLRNAAFAFLSSEERKWLRGKTLLDVGCGTGRETAELWLKYKGEIQITAIDSVPAMLDMAQQDFPSLLAEIQPFHPPLNEANEPAFNLASVTRLPFEDNSFDAAFYSMLLHWTPDPRRAIKEIVRVVKPGGLIFGVQGCKPHMNPYVNMVIRANPSCYGIFWQEEYRRWYAENGIELELLMAAFRAHKPNRQPMPG